MKYQIPDEDFRILAEDAPVMLWLTNEKGEIIFTNSRWLKFVGAEPGSQLTGEAWYNTLHPDDRKYCLQVFEEAFKKSSSFEMEYRLLRHDNTYRYVLDTGEPYIRRDGKFSGFIGSSTDITDRKNHENQLRRSQTELSRHSRQMGLINELNSYLQVCRTLEETHLIISKYAEKLFEDCVGALYLFNESRTTLEAMVTWGEDENHSSSKVITTDDCWALRQSKPHMVGEEETTILCNHVPKRPDKGYVCIPAIAQGEMIGFLHVGIYQDDSHNDDAHHVSIESLSRIVSISADNLAMALVSLKLREELKNQSVRDPLTKLFNRRYMEETLEREMARCVRNKTELGLMIMDIDHFKKYNDQHGHDAGDLVLRETADIVASNLRHEDVVCRFGGEELVVIMPGASANATLGRAEELRNLIKSKDIEYRGERLPNITVSVGVAAYPDHAENHEELIRNADTALYEAKNSGRDTAVKAVNQV